MTTGTEALRRMTSHLSHEALGYLRALLTTELEAQMAQAQEHQATAEQLNGHSDDYSPFERELAVIRAGRAREEMEGIEQAIARMEQGAYGQCTHCDASIPFERLEAIPQTRLCVTCAGLLG